MDQRTRRSPARFLAPLALIVFVIVFLAIVSGSGGNRSNSSSNTSSSTSAATTTGSTTSKKSATKKKTATSKAPASGASVYTVKVGDTLGSIADKTGVPLSKIQELNPNVDPHAMVAGQQIKLR